jgi:hypothetical protein
LPNIAANGTGVTNKEGSAAALEFRDGSFGTEPLPRCSAIAGDHEKVCGERALSAADEFRQHAITCLRAAQLTGVPDIKASLIDMAQHWNRLAERMDRLAVVETRAVGCGPEPGAEAPRRAGQE